MFKKLLLRIINEYFATKYDLYDIAEVSFNNEKMSLYLKFRGTECTVRDLPDIRRIISTCLLTAYGQALPIRGPFVVLLYPDLTLINNYGYRWYIQLLKDWRHTSFLGDKAAIEYKLA